MTAITTLITILSCVFPIHNTIQCQCGGWRRKMLRNYPNDRQRWRVFDSQKRPDEPCLKVVLVSESPSNSLHLLNISRHHLQTRKTTRGHQTRSSRNDQRYCLVGQRPSLTTWRYSSQSSTVERRWARYYIGVVLRRRYFTEEVFFLTQHHSAVLNFLIQVVPVQVSTFFNVTFSCRFPPSQTSRRVYRTAARAACLHAQHRSSRFVSETSPPWR